MKRSIVMPGAVLLIVVLLSLSFTLQSRKVQASLNVPKLPENLTLGQFMPPETPCYRAASELGQSYCHPDKDIDIVIQNGRIVRAYIFTYPSGITIGQLITAWGEPVGSEYDSIGATTVYWPDHYAYVTTQRNFSPYSRVGYIAYGTRQDLTLRYYENWRGFALLGK